MGITRKTWRKSDVASASKVSKRKTKKDNRSPKLSPRKGSKVAQRRVALVCDWLTTPGGAEKVLLELHRMYPDAPIYTSQYSRKGINWFDDADVRTGWLQIFPRGLRKFLGPLRQLYFSHLNLSDYDLVISVTGAEAKSVRTKRKQSIFSLYHTSRQKSIDKTNTGATHLCYCHVPTQYYWQMYDQYVQNPGFGILNPLVRFMFKALVGPLRKADYKAAQRPDQFVTISSYAREQIRKYYGRESAIVAPPVEIKKFSTNFSTPKPAVSHKKSTVSPQEATNLSTAYPQKTTNFPQNSENYPQQDSKLSTKNPQKSTSFPQNHSDFSTKNLKLSTETSNFSTKNAELFHNFSTYFPQFYVISCRQVTWKRIDLAIQACLRAKLPLLVVGDGPEHDNLLKIAGLSKNIRFLSWANTDELSHYLAKAKGYIFPSLEPFGIAAVEALAAGCPVIAYQEGGSRDFVKNGENGLLFPEQTVESLTKALQKFDKMSFNCAKVAKTAEKFDLGQFQKGIQRLARKPREIKVTKEVTKGEA